MVLTRAYRNRKLRHVLVFIVLDQDADDFHERRERMRLVFANLINEAIEQFEMVSKFSTNAYGVSV